MVKHVKFMLFTSMLFMSMLFTNMLFTNAVDVQPWSIVSLSLLLSIGTRCWTRCFLIRFKPNFPGLKPITDNTLINVLRAPIKWLISSDCFRVFLFTSPFHFSIRSSFSFFIFNFSKTSSYFLCKIVSASSLILLNLFRKRSILGQRCLWKNNGRCTQLRWKKCIRLIIRVKPTSWHFGYSRVAKNVAERFEIKGGPIRIISTSLFYVNVLVVQSL